MESSHAGRAVPAEGMDGKATVLAVSPRALFRQTIDKAPADARTNPLAGRFLNGARHPSTLLH